MTDKEREYQKKYREEHREERRQYHREYYQKNKEKQRASRRKSGKTYYEKHKNDPEYIAKNHANHAKWQRENKDYVNAYHRARYAEKGVPNERAD